MASIYYKSSTFIILIKTMSIMGPRKRLLLLVSSMVFSCLATVSNSDPDVVHSAAAIEDWIIDIRRELHRYPELMFQVRGISLSLVVLVLNLFLPINGQPKSPSI